MVEDGDKIASAAVMDGSANSPCTDRGFAFFTGALTIRRRKPWRAGRTPFHPGILGLGGAGGEEIGFTGT